MNQYTPPSSEEPRTMHVIRAYRAYAALMFMMYVAFAIMWGFFVQSSHGIVMPIAAALFAVIYAAAFVAPREPWAWTLGLVAIGIGMTGFTIVFAIPLLVFWLKPTTKAAFRRLP
jgi:hypothetical protein